MFDPTHLQTLCQSLVPKKESAVLLKLANHVYEQIKDLKKLREIQGNLKFQIDILTEDEKFLVVCIAHVTLKKNYEFSVTDLDCVVPQKNFRR